MKLSKKMLLLFFLFFFYLCLSIFSYSNAVLNDISSQVFRLHVVANSNESKDQELKLKVRDALIEYMHSTAGSVSSKQEAIAFITEHQQELTLLAQNILQENGFDYTVTLDIGNFSFPTKTYGDITLPAGFYDALKVKIGNASGQNWWCVLFPTLCFVDVSNGIVPEESKELLQSNLQEEDYHIITADKPEYQIKLKLIEFFENAKMVMAKK